MRTVLFIIALITSVTPGFSKFTNNILRFSFSESEDSLLATPEGMFSEYAKDLADFDIKISVPESFIPVDLRPGRFYIPRSDCFPDNPQGIYELGLRSDDDNAMILLPTLYFDFGNATLKRSAEIEQELRAVYKDCELDINPFVEIYNTKGLKGYSNADAAAFYEFNARDVNAQYADKYPHCLGVYLRKHGHPALLLKIILNDAAYANKDNYIEILLDNIEYGRNGTRLTIIDDQLKGFYHDLGFPSIPRKPYQVLPQYDPIPE